MSTATQAVRSLWIPLHDGRSLLLPNVAVAEIVDFQEPVPVDGKPEWLLGEVAWRGQQLPVICYEALCGEALPGRQREARLAIINTVKDRGGATFYALLTAGIPRLLRIEPGVLVQSGALGSGAAALAQVHLDGQNATIPDLDRVEAAVVDNWH
ncbi:MAG: chemotaxis protein CheW [Gammaproteobacteria bacterium]